MINESFWQQGCNDAKAGFPRRIVLGYSAQQGYDNGYHWGQHGRSQYERPKWWVGDGSHDQILSASPSKIDLRDGEFFTEDPDHGFEFDDGGPYNGVQINPYMETITFIEVMMENLPTNGLDKARTDEYRVNMLEVRDTLHRFRQAEMGSTAG